MKIDSWPGISLGAALLTAVAWLLW
jgi:hypothetical protein